MDNQKRSRDEEIIYQTEHYDEVPLWKSFRGQAVQALGLMYVVIGGLYSIYLQEYTTALVQVGVAGLLLFFVTKGHLWSIFMSMILVVFTIINGWFYLSLVGGLYTIWFLLIMGFFLLSHFLIPTLRVEQKRRFLLTQERSGQSQQQDQSHESEGIQASVGKPEDKSLYIKKVFLVCFIIFSGITIVAVVFDHISGQESQSQVEWQCLQHISYERDRYYFEALDGDKSFKTKDDAMEYCLMQYENTGLVGLEQKE